MKELFLFQTWKHKQPEYLIKDSTDFRSKPLHFNQEQIDRILCFKKKIVKHLGIWSYLFYSLYILYTRITQLVSLWKCTDYILKRDFLTLPWSTEGDIFAKQLKRTYSFNKIKIRKCKIIITISTSTLIITTIH